MQVNAAVASDGLEFYIEDGPCTSNGEFRFDVHLTTNDHLHEIALVGPLHVHHQTLTLTHALLITHFNLAAFGW